MFIFEVKDPSVIKKIIMFGFYVHCSIVCGHCQAAHSALWTGCGVSPMVVRVSVLQ